MENTTTETKEALVNDVQKLKDDAAQIAQDVRSHANAHVDEARQRFNEAILTVRETLATHPGYLVGAGFVIGLLCGLRLRR